MPSVSKKQRHFMAMVEHTPSSELSGKAKEAKHSMSHQQLHDFAKTKESGLPNRKNKRHDRVRSKYKGSMD